MSLLERNKYKFSPLELPGELPALFHGETRPPSISRDTNKPSSAASLATLSVRVELKKKKGSLFNFQFSGFQSKRV